MSCDVGEVTESLENQNELWRRWSDWKLGEWALLTYVTAHSDSPSFSSLHLHHSSFSNPSLALPTSQLILEPFCCFAYAMAHSPTLLLPLLHHRIFTYITWRAAHASPTSHALHLHHLASCPCVTELILMHYITVCKPQVFPLWSYHKLHFRTSV